MKGRAQKRVLSREELDLWAHVTRSDQPLQPYSAPPKSVPPPGPSEAPALPKPEDIPPVTTVSNRPKDAAKPITPRPGPEPFDPRVKRHLARGRRDIDARLDLHGLRQQTAYSTLKHFLAQAQAKGYRHVLIITGKGGPGVNDEDRDFWLPEERGVLRRLVPHWLSEAAFRPYVVTFTESAAQHGGSGALYITLRKSQTSRLRPR